MLRDLIAALALLTLCSPMAADELLPRPAQLEPNVQFWIRTYSEVDGQTGLLHDRDSLDVVYEVLHLPPGLSSRATERRTDKAKARIRDVLRKLARGKRTNLSAEQKRILD